MNKLRIGEEEEIQVFQSMKLGSSRIVASNNYHGGLRMDCVKLSNNRFGQVWSLFICQEKKYCAVSLFSKSRMKDDIFGFDLVDLDLEEENRFQILALDEIKSIIMVIPIEQEQYVILDPNEPFDATSWLDENSKNVGLPRDSELEKMKMDLGEEYKPKEESESDESENESEDGENQFGGSFFYFYPEQEESDEEDGSDSESQQENENESDRNDEGGSDSEQEDENGNESDDEDESEQENENEQKKRKLNGATDENEKRIKKNKGNLKRGKNQSQKNDPFDFHDF
jgi:hypothetical protein